MKVGNKSFNNEIHSDRLCYSDYYNQVMLQWWLLQSGYVTVSDDYYNQVMLQWLLQSGYVTEIITIRLCYRDYYNQDMLQWLLQSGYVTVIITIRLCYSDYYNQVMLQWLLQSVLMRLLSAVCPPNLQAMSTHRYSSHVLLLFICKNEKEFNVFW